MNTSDEYAVHELWKQIPEAARPAGLSWHDALECFLGDTAIADSLGHDGSGVIFKVKMHPAAVAMLLEASMMRWLIGEGNHSFVYELGDHNLTLRLCDLAVSVQLDAGNSVQTHVRALAAACKAVGT